MRRKILLLVLSMAVGSMLGLLVLLIIFGSSYREGSTDSLVPPDALSWFVFSGALGAANGGIGTWSGWRWGKRWTVPVIWIPMLLPLYPLSVIIQGGPNSKSAGGELVVFGLIGVFVWIGGRIGQHLGAATNTPPGSHIP